MPLDSLPCRYLGTFTADTVSVPPHVIANGPSGTRVAFGKLVPEGVTYDIYAID